LTVEPCVYLKSDLGEVFLLPDGQTVDGSHPDLHPPIQGAAFHRRGAQVWVTDLGSANGTFVNHGRVASQQWTALQDGDLISCGSGLGFRIFWAPL
jgi:FHA domain-containing protein